MKPNFSHRFLSRHFQTSFDSASATQISLTNSKQSTSSQISLPPSTEKKATTHLSFLKDFTSLIRSLSENNRNFKLLSALDSVLSNTHLLDSSTSVLVIDDLCRLKKLNRAKAVLSTLKKRGKVPDLFLYSLVFQCLVKDGTIADAEAVWADVCGPDQDRIDTSDFVTHVCRFGDGFEIESICKRILMGGGGLRRQSFIALIGALCRTGACLLAIDVLRQMEEMDLEVDDLTYITIFQSLCKNGNVLEADLILRNLIRRRTRLDICIYGSFVYGLCKSGKFREAEKLFRRLIRRSAPVVCPVSNLKRRRAIFQLDFRVSVPEVMAYEAYCRSLSSVGKVDEAEMLLKEMMRKRTVAEVCVYRSFIKALFRVGRGDDAVRFYNAQRKKGFVSAADIAGPVITGLCELGRVDDACELLNEIQNDGSTPHIGVFNFILDCYWKAKRSDEAINLFERMKHGKCSAPDVSTYTIMITGFCDCGDVDKAVSIFRQMIENKVPVDRTVYDSIIRGFCEWGRLEESYKYLNEMIEDGHLVSYIGWKLVSKRMSVGSASDTLPGF